MAYVGLKHPCFAPIATEPAGSIPTYGSGISLGKAIAANLSVNFASGELDADDEIAEHEEEFRSGNIACETDEMQDAPATVVYGATSEGGEIKYNKNDTPPYGGFGYYRKKKRNNVAYWKGFFYPRVKATVGNENAQTKGQSISFQTNSTTLMVLPCKSGDWRILSEDLTSEAAAEAWVDSKLNVATWYAMKVMVQGDDISADIDGTRYFAEAANVPITITGTPTAVYDNGVEVSASIVDGVYTVTGIAADHEIFIVKTAA